MRFRILAVLAYITLRWLILHDCRQALGCQLHTKDNLHSSSELVHLAVRCTLCVGAGGSTAGSEWLVLPSDRI